MRDAAMILLLLVPLLASCDDLPRDPEDSLTNAAASSLRVGIVEHPPWAQHEAGRVSGVEVELIEEFAADLGTEITWVRGGESALLQALERFELDVVIGGLDRDSPWSKRIGFTRTYYTNRFVAALWPGQHLESLAGVEVAVARDLPSVAGIAREHDAQVVTVASLDEAETAVVIAPRWQAALLGREPADIEVHQVEHVIAVAPGENRLLMRLERFLDQHASNVSERLERLEAAR